VLAFGEGVSLPTRLKFKQLDEHQLPRSEAVSSARIDPERDTSDGFLESVIERWRGATMSHKVKLDDGSQDLETLARSEFAPLQPGFGLDPVQDPEETGRAPRREHARQPRPLAAEVEAPPRGAAASNCGWQAQPAARPHAILPAPAHAPSRITYY
jgi:hypothetical protein